MSLGRNVWYFAYGSNMNPERMRKRIGEWSIRVPARLEGWRLVFNKIASRNPCEGYANIVPAENSRVEGCLYLLPETSLQKLDRCEGVVDGHYERRKVMVQRVDTGELIEAITYVACAGWIKDDLKPTRDYLRHLLAGADCLSEGYLRFLESIETLD